MATQLIHLPRHLIDAILISDLCEGWFAPNIGLEEVRPVQSETAVAVVVKDPALVFDSWRFHGQAVFTLLLTSQADPARDFLPRPLPDDLVTPVIRALISATPGSLCGHDVLELTCLLNHALVQPNAVPLPPLCRNPFARYERRLRESALLLQRRFAPVLAELQGEIATYGDTLLRSGLGPAIGNLATEGSLADSFSLKPSTSSGDCLTLHRGDFEYVASILHECEQAKSIRHMTNWMLGELAPYNPRRREVLSAFHITRLYRKGFADLRQDFDAPLWRRNDPRSSEFPISVPAVGVERAMLRFAGAFDMQLLADVDPLVRSALCWWQFIRINPFGQFDRQVAEVLVYVLLRQSGLPPLPLPLVMHRRYWNHALMLEKAFDEDQIEILVETVIDAVSESLSLGRCMIPALDMERACLTAGLADLDASLVDTSAIVSELLSNVLVNQALGSDLGEAARREYAFGHLHSKGAVDKIVANDRVWWSSETVRIIADGQYWP